MRLLLTLKIKVFSNCVKKTKSATERFKSPFKKSYISDINFAPFGRKFIKLMYLRIHSAGSSMPKKALELVIVIPKGTIVRVLHTWEKI